VATTSTATPALNGILRPDLSRVSKRLRASKTRRVKLRLRCSSAGTFAVPARCRGTVRISARLGRKTRRIGRRSFDFGLIETRTVTVRLPRSAYRRLRGRSLRATIRASVVSPGRGTQTASKRVRLVRRSR
jgi:hypothetical protein